VYYDIVKSGERINGLRTARRMTRQQLAEHIGLLVDALRKIEAGVNGAKIDTLVSIADVFEVSLDYLVSGSERKTDTDSLLAGLKENEIQFIRNMVLTDNIIKNKAFTVGVADLEHLVACDYVGIVSANKEAYKMQKAGFTTTKGEFVNAPIINELPLTLECELVKVIDGSKYLAEIKNVSADEKYLGDDGEIDLSKFTPITYDPVHHGYYRLGERVGNAFKDGTKLK